MHTLKQVAKCCLQRLEDPPAAPDMQVICCIHGERKYKMRRGNVCMKFAEQRSCRGAAGSASDCDSGGREIETHRQQFLWL